MSTRGKLIFPILVLVAIVLMVVSWVTPWWVCTVDAVYMLQRGLITIRPWGLEQNLGRFAGYVEGSAMPDWFGPMMWAYLVACIVVLLVALFVRNREVRFRGRSFNLSQLLVGLVGLSYIVCAATAAVFAVIRTGDFGVSFLGKTTVIIDPHAGGSADLNGELQWGYWLCYIVGFGLIALAYFRNRILGQPLKKA